MPGSGGEIDVSGVRIVLLNWQGYDTTSTCVESLRSCGYGDELILIVDNGSPDGSGPRLQARFPKIQYVQNETNDGFARGCNLGIRQALADSAEFILLLNNDCEVTPGFLEAMVGCIRSHDNVGLVSGKLYLLQPGSDDRIWYAGAQRRPFRGGVGLRGHLAPDPGDYDVEEPTEGCTGAMMLIPRKVLEQVGLLPEEYFFGMEEWDYSEQLRRAGYTLWYCPDAVVYHRSDGSHDNLSPKFVYCGHRNSLIYQSRYLNRPTYELWLRVYAAYVKWYSPRRLGYDADTMDMFQKAWKSAVRDHRARKDHWVTAEDLEAFEREFQKSKEH